MDPSGRNDRGAIVTVGSEVRVRDRFGEETFRIVNNDMSDPGRQWISEASPMAAALLGHHSGETVTVRAPDGVERVLVLDVATVSDT